MGREWQLGYAKLPPLPWWPMTALQTMTAHITDHPLAQLASAVAIWAVWRLGRGRRTRNGADRRARARRHSLFQFHRREVQPRCASASAVDAGRAVFLSRASSGADRRLAARRAVPGGGFWTKYSVAMVMPLLRCSCCSTVRAAEPWRTPGPYVAAALPPAIMAPHLWWLVAHPTSCRCNTPTRAPEVATHWHHVLTFPLQWTAGRFFILPAIGLVALLCARSGAPRHGGRRGRLRAALRHHAGVRAVRHYDAARARPRAAPGRDVGLSAVVIRAARRAALVRGCE